MRTHRRTLLATGLVALLTIAGVTAAIANDPPPRIAFLANGIVPADALAAGPIAGQLGAPIFTTAPDTLPTSTADAMSDYAPQLVIVMGGPVAISDAVVGQVSAATGLSVANPNPPPSSGIVRAAGQDRFETAAAAAALLAAYDPAYLPTDMKAIDSDKLDGKDSTAFQPAGDYLGTTQQAADSDKLDGKDSTAFLGAAQKAADADKLDGLDSSAFARPIASGEVNPSDGDVAITGDVTYEGNPSTGVYCFSLSASLGLTRDDIYGIATNDWSYGATLNSGGVHFRGFPGACASDEFAFFTDVFATDGDGDVVGTQPSADVTFGFLVFAEPSTAVATSTSMSSMRTAPTGTGDLAD